MSSASFSPNGELLAYAAGQKTVIREVASRKVVKTLFHPVVTMAFSPGGDLLAGGGDSEVKIWDTGTWGEVKSLPDSFFPAVFSPDGSSLVTRADGGFRVWNTKTWEPAGFCKGDANHMAWHRRHVIAFSPDGKLLLTPGESFFAPDNRNDAKSRKLQLWKFPSLEPLPNLAPLPDMLGSAAFLGERQMRTYRIQARRASE